MEKRFDSDAPTRLGQPDPEWSSEIARRCLRRLFPEPRLPPELIDLIIDHLHNDKVSLRACSRVCKAWTRSACFHLLSELHVEGPNAKRWLKRAPAPVVIPFVRHLLLGEQKYDETLPLLVGFESVKWLHITDLYTNSLNARALSALFRNFSAAVDVRLDFNRFDNANQLVRFICAFPYLQTLAVNCTQMGSDELGVDVSNSTTFSPSPHLRVLELDEGCMDAVLNWFLALPDPPALRAVGLHPFRNNSENIANFLSALENSLESFMISTAIAEGSRWPFDLRRNSCLRSVQIELVNADHAATLSTQMLSQISSTRIEEVGLTIGGCEGSILDPAIWNDIDAALQHSSFAGLKIVNVRLIPMDGIWAWNDHLLIMNYMP